MTKSIHLFLFSTFLLINGCASGPSTKEIVNIFNLYNSSETKSNFCNKHLELGMRTQECVNDLIIFTRSKDACKKSVNDKSCYIRHQNKWGYLNLNMKSAIGYIDGEFNPEAFDKAMSENAKTFQLSCLNSSRQLVPCSSM